MQIGELAQRYTHMTKDYWYGFVGLLHNFIFSEEVNVGKLDAVFCFSKNYNLPSSHSLIKIWGCAVSGK